MAIRYSDGSKGNNEEIDILRKDARILRRSVLNYRNKDSILEGSTQALDDSGPVLLKTFLNWFSLGEGDLTDKRNEDVNKNSITIGSHRMYCIENNYLPSDDNNTLFKKQVANFDQIGLGLAIHQYTRNKNILDLFSSPGYETGIGNEIIEKMNKNNGVFIPSNTKDVLPCFHLDNIDFSEDTPHGKATTHALDLVVFQQKITKYETSKIKLPPLCGKKLLPNTFHDLLECHPPSKKHCCRTDGCVDCKCSSILDMKLSVTGNWLFLKSSEIMYHKDHIDFWCHIAADHRLNNYLQYVPLVVPLIRDFDCCILNSGKTRDVQNDLPMEINFVKSDEGVCNSVVEEGNYENNFNALKNTISEPFEKLVIPSWSGTNSILCNEIRDEDLTNVFTAPLIAGPASDYNAIYTALMCANGISVWSCGENSKTVISCDLDLYETVYLLVNTKSELSSEFVICLGELHILSAYLRAISLYRTIRN